MAESFDVYTDVFHTMVTPWGTNLLFGLRPVSPEPQNDEPNRMLGVVRMSNEHLKVMCFMLQRQMVTYETEQQVTCDVSERLLAALDIPADEWTAFWKALGDRN